MHNQPLAAPRLPGGGSVDVNPDGIAIGPGGSVDVNPDGIAIGPGVGSPGGCVPASALEAAENA